MAKDAKLEQLKIAQDQAYKNKQSSYQSQQKSWEHLSETKDAMNRLHEIKQAAFVDQERFWQEYQSVRSRNGPRIDQLNLAQEIAFQNMKNAFDRASAAHDSRDGASAKSYADDGHRYQAEAKGYVEERRRLVEECRNTKLRHEPYKTAFDKAKIDFGRAKDKFEEAKILHQFQSVCFKSDKEKFDTATKAFQARLDELRAENANKIKNKRAIAAKAGVPYQYRDNVYVSEDPDGTVNIFFGGFGTPDGPGHGHYALNSNGDVTYKREPWDQHGHQNFKRDPNLQRRLATIALNSQQRGRDYAQSNTGPRTVQYEDAFVKVEVRSGYSIRYDRVVSDFLIYDKSINYEHLHIIMDDDGQELFAEWRPNH